jgi:sugar/nucleoside kinase (ribokinase family)
MGQIVVLVGNRKQFHHWLRHNVICVSSKEEIEKLRGTKIDEIYYKGTYYKWLDRKSKDVLDYLKI